MPNVYQEGKQDGYEKAVTDVLRLWQRADDGDNILDLSDFIQTWLYENGAI